MSSYYTFNLHEPPVIPFTPFVWWDNYFTKNELDNLQRISKKADTQATIGQDRLEESTRSTLVTWLPVGSEFSWLYMKIEALIKEVNLKYFRYDLTGTEPVQLANYVSAHKGKYDWHMDAGEHTLRKLSLVMQLSEPEEYEGGVLQLQDGSLGGSSIIKKRGYITIFPSWLMHCVTPVLSGERQSLVCWSLGPSFR